MRNRFNISSDEKSVFKASKINFPGIVPVGFGLLFTMDEAGLIPGKSINVSGTIKTRAGEEGLEQLITLFMQVAGSERLCRRPVFY